MAAHLKSSLAPMEQIMIGLVLAYHQLLRGIVVDDCFLGQVFAKRFLGYQNVFKDISSGIGFGVVGLVD